MVFNKKDFLKEYYIAIYGEGNFEKNRHELKPEYDIEVDSKVEEIDGRYFYVLVARIYETSRTGKHEIDLKGTDFDYSWRLSSRGEYEGKERDSGKVIIVPKDLLPELDLNKSPDENSVNVRVDIKKEEEYNV